MEARRLLCFDPNRSAGVPVPEILTAGWAVDLATNAEEAMDLLDGGHFHVGLALLEAREPCLHSVESLCNADGRMNWIALLPDACLRERGIARLIGESFYDYHTLPADPRRLLATLGHAYGMATLKQEGLDAVEETEEEMVGSSPAMLALFSAIRKVAGVEAPVLITGESGTGKELTAQAIHERSGRAGGPFVAVNCGAIPANLIQSELFGYEKGAFTGASQRRIGRIEAAARGTIFLDEIGDLPLDMQVNLLRFLQERTIERVGSTQPLHIDVRVVAATHVDLARAVAEGRFREDLYYRLHVLDVHVPALRERLGDVEVLARFFFRKFAAEKRSGVEGFSAQAMRAMEGHEWPGNVREMINRVRRAMVMSEHRLITPADLGLERRQSRRRLVSLAEARASAERQAVLNALKHSRNNVTQAAQQLGVSRITLYRLMEKMGIQP